MQRCGLSLLAARVVECMPARPAADATCGGLDELSGLTLERQLELVDAPLQIALDGVLQLDNVVAGVGLAQCQQGAEHIGSSEAANCGAHDGKLFT